LPIQEALNKPQNAQQKAALQQQNISWHKTKLAHQAKEECRLPRASERTHSPTANTFIGATHPKVLCQHFPIRLQSQQRTGHRIKAHH